MNHPGTNYFAIYNKDINFCLTDENGLAIIAECDGNPNVVAVIAGIFTVGCMIRRTDITSGSNIYFNEGTIAVPSWVAGGGGGGSITVTDGVTTVSDVTEINFTAGATVTDGGGGIADIAITASGSIGGTISQNQIAVGNTTSNTIFGTNSFIYGQTGQLFQVGFSTKVGLILDQLTNIYKFGDASGSHNGTALEINDSTKFISLTTDSEFAVADVAGNIWLDVVTNIANHSVLIGDTGGAFNNTQIIVDDIAGTVELFGSKGILIEKSILQEGQGSDVVAANNLSLGTDGNTFYITGNTQINLIDGSPFKVGTHITLVFAGNPKIINNSTVSGTFYPILLSNGVDHTVAASSTLDLVLFSPDGGTTLFWKQEAQPYLTSSSITIGTTTITSGTNTRILYDNSGIVGEYTITGTGTVVAMQTSPSLITPALGVATATSLAIGGATIGSNGLAVTGHLLLEGVTSTGATGTGLLVFGTSPTLTTAALGSSTATTQSAHDNSTKVATTAYVETATSTETEDAQSGTTYTFVIGDAGEMVTSNSGSATTFTVPTNASVAFPIGTRIDLLQIGAGKLTIAAAGGVTIHSQAGNLSMAAQYVGATLWKQGTNTWYLLGNLIA